VLNRLLLLFLVFGFSCTSNTVNEADLHYLNGYWEIKEVKFPDGNVKNYTINKTIDFIKTDSLKGFRKKVNPTLSGSFATNDDAELFTIIVTHEGVLLSYKNKMTEWTEELLKVSQEQFSARNSEGITYTYQRFEPINLEKQ